MLVPLKLCTYAESDWLIGGMFGVSSECSCILIPTHTKKKKKKLSLVDSCYWTDTYQWQQFELKPHWRLHLMVNHYVLLYMGVYNINCPYVYFSLLVALEIELSGWGT